MLSGVGGQGGEEHLAVAAEHGAARGGVAERLGHQRWGPCRIRDGYGILSRSRQQGRWQSCAARWPRRLLPRAPRRSVPGSGPTVGVGQREALHLLDSLAYLGASPCAGSPACVRRRVGTACSCRRASAGRPSTKPSRSPGPRPPHHERPVGRGAASRGRQRTLRIDAEDKPTDPTAEPGNCDQLGAAHIGARLRATLGLGKHSAVMNALHNGRGPGGTTAFV